MTFVLSYASLIGTRYGRLTVIAVGERKSPWSGEQYLLCKCDCGQEKEIVYSSLRRGRTRSCGCLRAENFKHTRRHGHSSNGAARGLGKQSKEYMAWLNAFHYCEYPRSTYYASVGGKGIKFHKPWREDFTRFLSDVGYAPGPEYKFTRIDRARDYEPGNVEWKLNPSHKKAKED